MRRRHHRLVLYGLDAGARLPKPLKRAVRDGASFVPAGLQTSVAISDAPRGVSGVELPLSDPRLRRKFWWAQYRKSAHFIQQVVVSTEELVPLLDSGRVVEVLGGPHATRQKAEYEADLAWEAPG